MNDNCNQLRNSLQEPLLSDPLLISQFHRWASYECADTKHRLRDSVVKAQSGIKQPRNKSITREKYQQQECWVLLKSSSFVVMFPLLESNLGTAQMFTFLHTDKKCEIVMNTNLDNKHTESSCTTILQQLQIQVSTNNTKRSEHC